MDQDLENTAGIWIDRMRHGDYESAWKHSDLLLEHNRDKPCWHLPRHFQYIWNGTSLKDKKVLVRCYHGLGDTIQFIRYAPLLKAVAAEVIVWVQPKLIRLLQMSEGIDKLMPLHDGAPDVPYDADIEIMELPHIFRSTLATIPLKIPYLSVPSMQLKKKQLAVGLVWKAGDWDGQRSMPFSFFYPFAAIQGIDFYIAQPNAIEAGWQQEFGLHTGEYGLYDYACFINGLDLLISIDSMPVHVAGALGIPVWTLLQANADWRWMEQREDSPWYPTMRLFRQKVPGDWQAVITHMCNELKQLVQQ